VKILNAETPITFITRDGRHVVVPWDATLANAVPHARDFTWEGERRLLLPNEPEEARVARNVGVPVPAPILTRYDWAGTQPWDIQRTTAALLTESPRCYVLSSMGTGKTRAVIYATDWLMRTKQASRALIIAPLSTLTPVWERELFQLMLKRRVSILYGSKEKRLKLLKSGADICVINHHGLRVLGQEVQKSGFDIVVLDELAIYRTRNTELWKAARDLVSLDTTRFAWGLTGSPTPNAPTDAWAQVRLLTPERTVRSFVAFQDLTMRKLSQFRWFPKPDANVIVHAAMSPSVRYTRDDVMELPECSVVDRAVKLDTDAAKAYTMMFNKARILTEKNESVSAVNQGVLHNKLLQLSCGFLYTDTKTVYALPAQGRLDALTEVLDETERKVLVLVPFLHALTGVATHLRKHNYDIATVHGGTSRGSRDKIFNDFQMGKSPRIIVAHPQTLSHGLTLTEADTIVWYSPTTSNETYEQANARINRPGQKHKTMIVHMVGTTVERATYTRLRDRQRMQNCLLDLFHKQDKAF
jgi:SNF2 family DNA or RNA helicase